MKAIRSLIGKFIHTAWTALNIRCKNGTYHHLRTVDKCKTYENILILFSYAEFKAFCFNNEALIKTMQRPSIDRINSKKHYSLDNIRIVELIDNSGREQRKAKNGECVCCRCGKTKLLTDFCKDNRTLSGRSTRCKSCDAVRNALK